MINKKVLGSKLDWANTLFGQIRTELTKAIEYVLNEDLGVEELEIDHDGRPLIDTEYGRCELIFVSSDGITVLGDDGVSFMRDFSDIQLEDLSSVLQAVMIQVDENEKVKNTNI